MRYDIHPLAEIFPLMGEAEYAAFFDDVARHGQREPIWIYGNSIIDGRNRYRACNELGLVPIVKPFGGSADELPAFVVSLNLHRRHLSEAQRGMVAAKLANINHGENQHTLGAANLPIQKTTQPQAANLLNVSERTVRSAVVVQSKGVPELAEMVQSGEMSVSAAEKIARQPIDEQREIIKNGVPHVAHNSGENEWYTPTEYIEAARRVLRVIDLDPASSAQANKTVKAKTFYTKQDDGLSKKWAGSVWMNPPYAAELIGRFCDKYAQGVKAGEIDEGIVLVNNATETKWFRALVGVSVAVVFTSGRIKFIDQNGNATGAPLQGQAIIYAGPNSRKFLDEFSVFGWGAIL